MRMRMRRSCIQSRRRARGVEIGCFWMYGRWRVPESHGGGWSLGRRALQEGERSIGESRGLGIMCDLEC